MITCSDGQWPFGTVSFKIPLLLFGQLWVNFKTIRKSSGQLWNWVNYAVKNRPDFEKSVAVQQILEIGPIFIVVIQIWQRQSG